MVRTRVMVRLDARRDRCLVTARHERVHEPLAAVAREVVITEAQSAKIAHIVRQQQIGRDE